MSLRSMFECLKKLHTEELYDDLCLMGGFFHTATDRSTEAISPQYRFQGLVYYADALFQLNQVQKAETVYYKALHLRRDLARLIDKRRVEFTGEAEVRFRLHKCLLRQDKQSEALGVLEAIAGRARPLKVKAALASLYALQERRASACQTKGAASSAADNYRALLQEAPFALHSLVALLRHTPVDAPLPSAVVDELTESLGWFADWLRAQRCLVQLDLPGAVRLLGDLSARGDLSGNVRLLTDLALAHHAAGDSAQAVKQLQRVHTLDPYSLPGMDVLASLICEERSTKELECLATQLMTDNPNGVESLIAFGYLCRLQNKLTRALYFAHKACTMSGASTQTQAMLLKGRVLLDSHKLSDAKLHFREALVAEPRCFELYDGLVSCALEQNSSKDAMLFAQRCHEAMGGASARALLLKATVLERDADTLPEARAHLEEALQRAPNLLPAVYRLVDVYDKLRLYDEAIVLLRAQTSLHVNSKLHRLLGDHLAKANRADEAFDNYRAALSLEPTDARAHESLDSLDTLMCSPAFATPDAPPFAFTQLAMAPRRLPPGAAARTTPAAHSPDF